MLLIDFGALWILAYLLVGMLNVIPSAGEKAALSFALALGLKSLMLFGWVAFGETPNALIQTGLSLAALVFVFIFRRRRSSNFILPPLFPQKKSLHFSMMAAILGILFLLSLVTKNV